jgi:predicted dehydrogenase
MKRERVRWGILGTGRIAQQFAQDLAHVENGELIAVASRSVEGATQFARRFDVPNAHGSYAELFADESVDAVYIATPHTMHAQNCLDAFDAGKAVLCEKPLTTTPAECETVVAAAARTGCYLMEGMWTFFLPAVRTALEWTAQGRIGRLKHIKADFGYPLLPFDAQRREYDAALGGGCLLEMGIYPVALAWLFLRREPRRMHVIRRDAPNGVEDDIAALFDYDDCTATLATSFRCKLQNWAYIIGDEGYIAIPDFWRASECSLYRLDERVDRFSDGRVTLGFEFEARAASCDILARRQQSAVVPWSSSATFQDHIAKVKASSALR